ncbi:MAG TPA: TetR/AcrR family transcriptional regulator [Opitutaceae bacterium]|nr:TetR/AcrR family transcriptional regulator [Opitutaceae bacterium]
MHLFMTRPETKKLLLDAAARVFAREGLSRATTREIAREAGVNEVTLFRHFGSKKRLLAAVLGQTFVDEEAGSAARVGDLRADLTAFAKQYETGLVENLALVCALLGEIQHHREHEKRVLKGIFEPLKNGLIARLELARKGGEIRHEIDATLAADQLSALIFTGVLRCSSRQMTRNYSPEDYLKASVDLFMRGIAEPLSKSL